MKIRHVFPLWLLLANAAVAQVASDFIPATAPNCAIETPPATVGLVATPGGFVMVYPRNDALQKPYTGCKTLWVVTGERPPRFATLYFKDGNLVVVAAHNIRDASGRLDGACAFPEGKSLMSNAGREVKDSGCTGFAKEGFYQLYVPTWPRLCMTDPKAEVCQQEPR